MDMAVESGGNVEGSKLDEVVEVGGVKIIGQSLPSEVARNALRCTQITFSILSQSSGMKNRKPWYWIQRTRSLKVALSLKGVCDQRNYKKFV